MKFLKVLLIFFLIAVLVCAGVFVYDEKQKKDATSVVMEFLESYQHGNGQICGKLLYNNDLNVAIDFSETERLLAKGVDWKIVKCHWEKNIVRVTVEIENLDFSQVFEALLKQQDEVKEDELNSQISQVQAEEQYSSGAREMGKRLDQEILY